MLAGAIHFWAMPEHFAEWWGYGAFFAAVGAFQVGYGLVWFHVATHDPWLRPLIILGLAAHVAVFAVYGVSRTYGIPFFGPHAWEVEPVGLVDVLSKTVEVFLVAGLVRVFRSGGQQVAQFDHVS